jgi:hypothetical protein
MGTEEEAMPLSHEPEITKTLAYMFSLTVAVLKCQVGESYYPLIFKINSVTNEGHFSYSTFNLRYSY